MTWFAIFETASGRLHSTGTVIVSDAELAARGFSKLQLADDPQVNTKKWNTATRDFDTVPAPKDRIDTVDFWKRFTVTEIEDIHEEATKKTTTAKKTRGFVETYRSQGSIVLDDPTLVAGVNALETNGLIGAGRAAEVLT